MSTDGTRPPTIAPRGTAGTAGARPDKARPDGARSRPATGPLTSDTSPAASASSPWAPSASSPSESAPERSTGPSVSERLKRAASGVAESARNALPSRDGDDDAESARESRPTTTLRPAAAGAPAGPRKVRLAVARIDPWSVMKLAFLLSVAIGIMIVVAAAVTWFALDGLHIFTQVNSTITEVTGDPEFFDVLELLSFERVISLATMIAVVDVVILTALSTIGAFLYNIVAALVGGIHLTLTDD